MDRLVLPVALVGLSGSGKSSVARALATLHGWQSYDTDGMIIAQQGMPVAEVFRTQGEVVFRTMETTMLETALAAATPRTVVATGGGIVVKAVNRMVLQQRAYTVWLDAPVDVLLARLRAHDEDRPLLAGDDPRARLSALWDERLALYQQVADLIIDTTHLDAPGVAARITQAHGQ